MATKTAKRPGTGPSLRDRQALLDHEPAPFEIVEEARAIKERALLTFGLGESVVASWLFSKCHYQIPTTAIPTMAVTASGDGTMMLLYNPYFTVQLGEQGALFVLFHESRHIVMRHLFAEPHLNGDEDWNTATELCINHVVMTRLKRQSMPEIEVTDPITGKVDKQKTGIDPREVYKQYKANLKEQGLEPVEYASFVATDFGCYTELKRMSKPPKPNKAMGMACIHQDGDGTEGPEGEGPGVQMDQDTIDQIGAQVIHNAMQAAKAGKEKARDELLELGERTDGATERTSKLWGTYGLASLRGKTQETRRVDWWQQWTTDFLASKLQEGERTIYPKKRLALDIEFDLDPMLVRRGEDEIKVGLIFYDTSGSMPDHVVKWLTELVGHTEGLEVHWCSFDGVVMPFKAGEKVSGGGGTNFQNCVDYAEGRLEVNGARFDEEFDFALMLTDGYASEVKVQDADKWAWLITEGGSSAVPEAHNPPMAHHEVPTGAGVEN